MNKKLLNLIKFMRKTKCERSLVETEFFLFLHGADLSEFCKIVELIDDGGYPAFWKGSYFCIDIAPFVEDYEDLSLEDFVSIVGATNE